MSNMPVGIKQSICVEQLLFDSNNPRIPKNLQGVTNENKVIEYMVKFGNVTELMMSIAETGYSDAEPLLVVGTSNDKFIVVEGNRRLAALKILNNPSLTKLRVKTIKDIIENAAITVPNDVTEVPCIIYRTREEILDYLGYRHITGVKDWGALEKARYLEQLYEMHVVKVGEEKIFQKLAKMIGSRSDYVRKLYMALQLYDIANDDAYYGANIDVASINFSWITTAIGHSSVINYLGISGGNVDNLNKAHLENLFVWMFDSDKGIIPESREISTLAAVLDSEEATNKLEAGYSLSEAVLFTSEPNKTFVRLLQNSKNQLKQAKLAIEQLSEKPEEAEMILSDIEKLCKTIKGALYVNFDPKMQDTMSITMDALSNVSPEQLTMLLGLLGKK